MPLALSECSSVFVRSGCIAGLSCVVPSFGIAPAPGALRERVGLLAGLKEAALERTRAKIRITPGAWALVATMRRSGAYCALVSGGFSYYTATVRMKSSAEPHRERHCEDCGAGGVTRIYLSSFRAYRRQLGVLYPVVDCSEVPTCGAERLANFPSREVMPRGLARFCISNWR